MPSAERWIGLPTAAANPSFFTLTAFVASWPRLAGPLCLRAAMPKFKNKKNEIFHPTIDANIIVVVELGLAGQRRKAFRSHRDRDQQTNKSAHASS
jgi:hypothetical protein